MKRFLSFFMLVFALLMPSHAIAGTPYSINWSLTSEAPDCLSADIVEGGPFFHLNGTPLPTFSVAGSYTIDFNGFEHNLARAEFDSVLLRTGANGFDFAVTAKSGNNTCVHSSDLVTLLSPQLGIEKLLFNIRRDGTSFAGSTQLDLKLEEINPQLAQDIANLEAEIANERKWLVSDADKIIDLDERLDALQQLETELGDLLTRPLDEITAEDLDEMLNRYSAYIDDATRAALQQVLVDLKQSIVDLQNELASLIETFGAQADAITDLLTGEARNDGFQPDDPSNYGLGANDIPWVDVPDISNIPGAFDPANDPYAAYADAVIASLDENVSNNVVVGRADFVAQVRAWRKNQKALETAMLERVSISQAETNAFLSAQNKVTAYLQKYMNASGWFLDAPVPQDVRVDVDGVLKNLYGALADDLKDRLNEWEAATAPEQSGPLFDTIRAFSEGMQAANEIAEQYRDTMQTIVHGATRIGLGFVPFVGPALDLCEAVSGHEFCLPSGRMLNTDERILSGVGFGIGKLVKVWKGVSTAAISGEGKLAAAGIVALDDIAEMMAAAKKARYESLLIGEATKSISKISNFEKTAARYLVKQEGHQMLGFGDDAVRRVLGILENAAPPTGRSFDFLTITKTNRLALSEVKAVTTGQVDVKYALSQLDNGMRKLGEKNLAESVERVQIIVPKGAALKNGYILKPEGLFNTVIGEFVTMTSQGRPDLIVQLVELVEL